MREEEVVHGNLDAKKIMIKSDGDIVIGGFDSKESDFTSPEVLQGSDPCMESDLWAFGCLIFQMHTGIVPFSEPDRNDKICGRNIVWPEALDPNTRDIIDSLL